MTNNNLKGFILIEENNIALASLNNNLLSDNKDSFIYTVFIWDGSYRICDVNSYDIDKNIIEKSNDECENINFNILPGDKIYEKILVETDKIEGTWGSSGFKQLILTNDGGFIVVGRSNSPTISASGTGVVLTRIGGNDGIIVKFDASGNVVWQKNYGNEMDDALYGIITTNNEIITAGYYGNNAVITKIKK